VALKVETIEGRLSIFSSLYTAYIEEFSTVERFFSYNPSDSSSYVNLQERLGKLNYKTKEELSRSLTSFNHQLNADERAITNAMALKDRDTLVVLTTDRPAFAGGPLSVLNKAITTIKLAEQLEKTLGTKVIPVFYTMSDDFNTTEVAKVMYVDSDGQLRNLVPEDIQVGAIPVGNIKIDTNLRERFKKLAEELADDGLDELRKPFRETFMESKTVGEWFNRLLSRLFSSKGLVMMDALDPSLYRSLSNFYQQSLTRREAINRELRTQESIMNKKGFIPSLKVANEHTHLFYRTSNTRSAILWQNGEYADRKGNRSSVTELVKKIAASPQDFSTDAVLRPVMQSQMLPVLAYVAGPTEINIMAQIKEVYNLFGLQMPVVVPRGNLTIIDETAFSIMNEFNLRPLDVFSDLNEELNNTLKTKDTLDLSSHFQQEQVKLEESLLALGNILTELQPELLDITTKTLEKMKKNLAALEKKAWQHHKRNNKEIAQKFKYLSNSLYPDGQPQDETLGIVPFIHNYGGDLIKELQDLPQTVYPQIVYLKE